MREAPARKSVRSLVNSTPSGAGGVTGKMDPDSGVADAGAAVAVGVGELCAKTSAGTVKMKRSGCVVLMKKSGALREAPASLTNG